MNTAFSLRVPADFLLARDVNSYGYILLDPFRWEAGTGTFVATVEVGGRAVTLRVRQAGAGRGTQREGEGTGRGVSPPGDAASRRGTPDTRSLTVAALKSRRQPPGTAGAPLTVKADAALSGAERGEAKATLTRILRLDEPAETIRAFHRLDPRWKKSGRGRLMRSGSLFEDVIKTVTSCNVAWPSTVRMNARLCERLGARSASGLHAFPSARTLARTRPATLRSRCGVGYRDARIVELARLFSASPVRGGVDQARLQDPATPDDAVHEALLELPGVGPYAAANIMQLMGRYARLPLDTESVRHGKVVLGYTGTSKHIMKTLHGHYAPFGDHAFRSYWFELWDFYEKHRGPSWLWDKERDGAAFTAAQMKALAEEMRKAGIHRRDRRGR